MSYHREAESALDRAESAVSDAQEALAALTDTSDVEDDAGVLADDLRSLLVDVQHLPSTDIESVESAIQDIVSQLENACTNASDLYNRL